MREYDFRSVGTTPSFLRVKLLSMDELPADSSEEGCCPITLERFDEGRLDYCQSVTFIDAIPSVCIGQLPCGHNISIMPLVNHFAMGDMRCPMCRCGFSEKLDFDCLPAHMRHVVRTRAVQAMRDETDAQHESDRNDAIQMMQQDMGTHVWAELIPDIGLFISMYYFEAHTEPTQIATLQVPMHPMGGGRFVYDVHPSGMRLLSQGLNVMIPGAVRITVHTRSLDGELMRISDTQIVSATEASQAHVVLAGVGSAGELGDEFTISGLGGGGDSASLRWTSRVDVLTRILSHSRVALATASSELDPVMSDE
jgi:hypothetical protein